MTGIGIAAAIVAAGGGGYLLGALMSRSAEADRIQEFYLERAKMQKRLQEQSDAILEMAKKNAHYISENQLLRGAIDKDLEDDGK